MARKQKFYRITKATQRIMYAAGTDVANRLMRKAGRTQWSREDHNAACAEFQRLIPLLGTPA